MDKEWWRQLGICWRCFTWLVCVAPPQQSCLPHKLLSLCDSGSPLVYVLGYLLPCSTADIEGLEQSFEYIFEALFWLSWKRLPSPSSPYHSPFGSRWFRMRTTCPAQRSCNCIKIARMLGRRARVSTSVTGLLSCHVLPGSFLKQVVWKWFIFLT